MAKEKLTHKQQIADRRAKAAEMVAKQRKEHKQRKIAFWSTVGVILLIAVALIVFIVTNGNRNRLEVSEVSPNAAATNGIIMTSLTDVAKGEGYNLESGEPATYDTVVKDSDVPHIEIYLDYDCPHCKDFEDSSAQYLNSLLQDGKATVEYKPIVVIGSNLSLSGGNAAACVAEYAPNRFGEAHEALFELQGQQGISVSKTIRELNIEGETGEQVSKCVGSKVFSKWLTTATEKALELTDDAGQPVVAGTPTILVDGVKYPYDPTEFSGFVNLMIESGKTAEEIIAENGPTT